jgi:hypothetical protein
MNVEGLATKHEISGLKLMPHWVAQPYFRPLTADGSKRAAKNTPKTKGAFDFSSVPCPSAVDVAAG